MEDKNDFSREPTKNERMFGIVASLVIFLLCGAVAVAANSLFYWVLAVLAGFIAYRLAFGQAKSLSGKSIRLVSYAFIVTGILSAGLSIFVSGLSDKFFLLGLGVTAVSTGIRNLRFRG